jgi:hypothetical protein
VAFRDDVESQVIFCERQDRLVLEAYNQYGYVSVSNDVNRFFDGDGGHGESDLMGHDVFYKAVFPRKHSVCFVIGGLPENSSTRA